MENLRYISIRVCVGAVALVSAPHVGIIDDYPKQRYKKKRGKMLIQIKNGLLEASQFLAEAGYWDIFTTCRLHNSGKVSVSIMLRIPTGKRRKPYPAQNTKDVQLCKILFPSLVHLDKFGKLLSEFSKNLEKGETNF